MQSIQQGTHIAENASQHNTPVHNEGADHASADVGLGEVEVPGVVQSFDAQCWETAESTCSASTISQAVLQANITLHCFMQTGSMHKLRLLNWAPISLQCMQPDAFSLPYGLQCHCLQQVTSCIACAQHALLSLLQP